MKRRMKIVRTYGASHRKRNLFIAVVLVVLAVLGVIIAMNLYDEYHTYHSSEATVFETISEENDGVILNTETKELLGRMYAGFSISDAESGDVVYQCPDLYLVKELQSIGWGTDQDTVIVKKKDGTEVTYHRNKKIWEKQ